MDWIGLDRQKWTHVQLLYLPIEQRHCHHEASVQYVVINVVCSLTTPQKIPVMVGRDGTASVVGGRRSVAGELKSTGQRLLTAAYSADTYAHAHTVVWLRVELSERNKTGQRK